jgi:hypothetical protein
MKGLLPEEICWRPKFAYQAPEVRAFFRADKTNSPLVDRYLTEGAARRAGFFDPGLVGALRQKIELSELSRLGTRDNMALIQILSTHILQAELMDADIPGQAREKAKGLSFKTRIREDRRTVPP